MSMKRKFKALVLAAMSGGAVAYFLDPAQGERRREALSNVRNRLLPPKVADTPTAEPDPVPVGATLVKTINTANRDGFLGEFTASTDGTVVCGSCESRFDASRLNVVAQDRLEGESDAADLLLVVSGTCPSCLTGGRWFSATAPTRGTLT